MKKICLIFILMASSVIMNAQKVALHSSTGIQHFNGTSGLVDAYNAATSGDTIYLPGGGYNAPSKFEKQLLIYGAGHYPDSTDVTAKTYLNGSVYLSDEADGFHLEGVEINGSLQFDNNEAINNVIIKYCKMIDLNVQGNLSVPSNNLTLINNVFSGGYFYLSNAQNAGIFNCIITGRVLNSFGNSFQNNIFLYNYTGATNYYPLHGDNNLVISNIFLNASNRYLTGVSNKVYRNLFVTASPNLGTTPIDSANYSPVTHSSIFVDQSGYTFNYDHNYHLQNPSLYPGFDNTQVGIYGGIFGYKEGAVPSNPHIQFESIAPTTDSNGILNIRIRAEAQDN